MNATDYIENIIELHPARPYGAILGLSPSKGARSPILWRKAFAALNIDADFHPFDVAEESLPSLVSALKSDQRFIGGAVAVPHKELLVPLIDIVDPTAKIIGAVNALRRTSDAEIAGANTDGLAALDSLTKVAGKLEGRSIALLGLGGAGKAVATCIAMEGAQLTVWNRTAFKAHDFAINFPNVDVAASPNDSLKNSEILVNCTSVGFSPNGTGSKESLINTNDLEALSSDAVVFDIIYQPLKTPLLKAAEDKHFRTLNGLEMNLNQAVIAFNLIFPQSDFFTVHNVMKEAQQ
jgi:shikimate dehydrogenase